MEIRRIEGRRVGLMLLVAVASLASLCVPSAAEEEDRSAALRVAQQLLQVVDLVLEKHFDPPTGQEMLRAGIRSAYEKRGRDSPQGLARQLSELSSDEQIESYLAEKLAQLSGSVPADLGEQIISGAMAIVPGSRSLESAEHQAVANLIRENRYVGIGVTLARADGFPVMLKVLPHGPAYRAGAKDGDILVTINGQDARQVNLPDLVAALRSHEGEPIAIEARQPDGSETRTLTIIRGHVPFPTIAGNERSKDGQWSYRVEESGQVAYLKIESLLGSVVSDLRQAAQQLHAEGFRALIVDLRSQSDGELRHAVMLADELLPKCRIGAVIFGDRREEFLSRAENLFAGWPMAVLINERTGGQSAWIAAALRDNRRAMLVGSSSRGGAHLTESFPLGDAGTISIWTGIYERANGQRLPCHLPAPPIAYPSSDKPSSAADPVLPPIQRRREPAAALESDIGTTDSEATTEAVEFLKGELRSESEAR